MTRTPNAYPETTTPTIPPELDTNPGFGARLYRRAAVAAGSLLLLSACTSGETGIDSSATPTNEATAAYPDNPQTLQPEAPEVPESQRAILQIECLNHASLNSYLDPATPGKVEIDLIKNVRGKIGIVSKVLFDVEKDGISMQIKPTGHQTINKSWDTAELYANKGYKLDYDGKTVLRYPAWQDGATGRNYVTFTIGCEELEPKKDTPAFKGAQPIPATIVLPPSKV